MHGTPPSTRAARPWPLDDALRGTLSALAFWLAIVLPALYLPLLVAGIQSTDGLVTFLGLLGLHLVALVGGRRYRTATH
jgi:hypothetical protein